MLTSRQRDILAGVLTYEVINRMEGLNMNDIIAIYETNREGVDRYVVEGCLSGREESLERMGKMPDRNFKGI